MTARTKPKAPRRSPTRPHEYAALPVNKAHKLPDVIVEPSPADIRRALTARLPKPGTPVSPAEADRILAANGIPPAKPVAETPSKAPDDTLREAFPADVKILRRFGELVIYSFNVVVSHLLASVIYALCTLVFLLTIYEGWTPAKMIADGVVAWQYVPSGVW